MRPHELRALMILARGPIHAYGIALASEEDNGVTLEIGSLYRMLNRLLTDRLIAEAGDVDAAKGSAGIRKAYRITKLGERVLDAEIRRLEEVVAVARSQRTAPWGRS